MRDDTREMKEKSFSQTTKEALLSLPVKKGCCRHALSDALSLKTEFPDNARDAVKNVTFKCPQCAPHFMRGLFISFGNVTSPEKEYHLEFSLETAELLGEILSLLQSNGMNFRGSVRKGKYIAYLKGSEEIEDFLCVIGANSAAFEYMNSKIVRELRNNTNRQVNCDSANIEKSLSASKKYTSVIEMLREAEIFNEMPDILREASRLRVEFPEDSLARLGTRFTPPISKSGVKHRLDSVLEFAAKHGIK